ncbi:glycosyl hydrolase family 95 catalytic domain-containing protein [Pedobacter ghigonis]|uniref:glycosyl hydrolase family 95 catalytic domain-containing protein n=1 Tax=Pedobacter ghigonis TaxID=2730403 RepID=UPI00158B7920|nr:glycoside hydrolase N-terminal domain-containing protein [Pedobacter ghigonis]
MKTKISIFLLLLCCTFGGYAQRLKPYNLSFPKLADKWDEAMPLGNGMLGALIWEKNNKLRLSLDRADLWDERKAMDISKFNFKWVEEQVHKNNYGAVQKLGDEPYDRSPFPTKLPAAALEFDMAKLGKVVANDLDIETALNTVKFDNGAVFNCYIHATEQRGYFSFSDLKATDLLPALIVHNYSNNQTEKGDNSHAGVGLQKLGYGKGTVVNTANSVRYHQPTYEGHYFEVLVQWQKMGKNKIIGSWTITSDKAASLPAISTTAKEPTGWIEHTAWWKNFWSKSSISVPDALIQKQYYLEMYKLGSVSRKGAPAITLQAVWTADNGSLPPWKGDFHNDLNTQLSYWPTYTGNHLAEGATFTDWLWKIRDRNLSYTKQYFGVEGLNVPGVVTLNGDPMGGWIQYSLSPTVGAWASQHFYWQWKYSMDDTFLKTRAYPYIHDVATYLENITRLKDGVRKLPLSSSPEYNDNSIKAWFLEWTNFDLSLAKFLFKAAAEVSQANGKEAERKHWLTILSQLPEYEVNETGFTIAPGANLTSSHRHMSQYMAIYPLDLLDVNKEKDKTVIENSLKRIEEMGTRAWCGYSFSWMASLYARAYQADKAVKQLEIFASNFCSANSFHLNGDQKGGQYSGFTYRPFTLEGNFAFAQGVQELLVQSRNGYIQVFPAVPQSWANVSFKDLRTEGAFLVSAAKENGVPAKVKIYAEKGGVLRIKLPFKTYLAKDVPAGSVKMGDDGIAEIKLKAKQTVTFENGYE